VKAKIYEERKKERKEKKERRSHHKIICRKVHYPNSHLLAPENITDYHLSSTSKTEHST